MRVTTSPTYLTLEDFFFFYFLLLLESQQSCDQYNDNNGNYIIEKEKIKECWNQVGILIDREAFSTFTDICMLLA